jgi:hypothetical protein
MFTYCGIKQGICYVEVLLPMLTAVHHRDRNGLAYHARLQDLVNLILKTTHITALKHQWLYTRQSMVTMYVSASHEENQPNQHYSIGDCLIIKDHDEAITLCLYYSLWSRQFLANNRSRPFTRFEIFRQFGACGFTNVSSLLQHHITVEISANI